MLKKWEAEWISPETEITPDQRRPAGVLRTRFELGETDGLTIFATAHGIYEVYLNGQRVGKDVFAPGCDEYESRLQVQAYDASGYARNGENELIVMIGDGWWRGCVGIDSTRNLFGEDISFLCQMEQDERVVAKTGEDWEASSSGPVRENDLEQGETYDARMENITEWHPARKMEFGMENLVETSAPLPTEKECFEGKLITTPNGETVFDFSQNLAGYTELEVTAEGGEEIRITHGETLDEHGNFTTANFQPGERNREGGIRQEIRYICKKGENRYHPRFSLFGFRYAKVEGDLPAEKIRMRARAVYSDMKELAEFACGNEKVNRLFQNCVWSMKSNFCDIPTDCPTRERAGWTGDAGVFAPTGLQLMDCAKVLQKWLENAKICQRDDGRMAYIIPRNGPGGQISEMFSASVGWGDASVIVPWEIYRATGDISVLEKNYGMMKKWVDFLRNRAKEHRPGAPEGPYSDVIIDTGMDYGEWCEPGANVMETMQRAYMFGQPEVATAYFSHSAEILSHVAALIGKEADAKEYRAVAEKAKEAYAWLWRETIEGKSRRQCEYVRPLAFGLLDGKDREQAARELDTLVRENGYKLNTGFLSTPDLCRVLSENGYTDTAYRMLVQEECPGWLYAVSKGATTVWETWDGIREDGTAHDSLNHYAYGAIAGWLLRGVCGIRADISGIRIEPLPHPLLGFARAKRETMYGEIVSAWEIKDGTVVYDITVPAEAVICLRGEEKTVSAGTYRFEEVYS